MLLLSTVLARLAHSLVGFYRGLRLAIIIIIPRVPRDRKYHYQRSPPYNSRITLPSSFAHQQTKIHCLFPFLIWDPFTLATASHPLTPLLFIVLWLVFYLLPHRAPIILNIILMRAAIVYLIVISLLIDLRPPCLSLRGCERTNIKRSVVLWGDFQAASGLHRQTRLQEVITVVNAFGAVLILKTQICRFLTCITLDHK